MDLHRVIRNLHEELKKLNQVIAALEEFQRTGNLPAPKRRGRKSMGAEERKMVSRRMKLYWEQRRNQRRRA
jgi:hypothetical protein